MMSSDTLVSLSDMRTNLSTVWSHHRRVHIEAKSHTYICYSGHATSSQLCDPSCQNTHTLYFIYCWNEVIFLSHLLCFTSVHFFHSVFSELPWDGLSHTHTKQTSSSNLLSHFISEESFSNLKSLPLYLCSLYLYKAYSIIFYTNI